MKTLFTSFLILSILCSQAIAQGKQKKLYIVTTDNDTVVCSDESIATFGGINCTGKGGKDKHYKDDDVIAYRGMFKAGLIGKAKLQMFEKRPRNPKKPDSKKVFMELLLRQGSSSLYMATSGGGMVNTGAGGMVGGGSSTDYYLYSEDQYIEEVKRGNFREILPNYFKDCDAFISKLDDTGFGSLDEAAREYRDKCK